MGGKITKIGHPKIEVGKKVEIGSQKERTVKSPPVGYSNGQKWKCSFGERYKHPGAAPKLFVGLYKKKQEGKGDAASEGSRGRAAIFPVVGER